MSEGFDEGLASWKANIRRLEKEEGLINLAWDRLEDRRIPDEGQPDPEVPEALRQEYTARRELMLSKLAEPSWDGTAIIAAGSRHIWLRLPEGLSSTALLRAALLEGAAFLPGPLATTEPAADRDRLIRLSYTGYGCAQLAVGLDRVAAAIGAFTARLDQDDP
ncbi:hypothetical protein [Paenibacillus physcomitrellae]|uniref:Aminotransferase class I/classII domain-containing protein n=1 Tax=Paenibacillus physcomitrellae TaxID=1619311 RepID=A0ABQ1G7Z2_9BACL|nr:hypothetical protein [Paenibacillus physcomitrellae]GGA38513.1 hypothetical protein GCM10010917_24760 [Paenibacillus physcomitrellae]